MNSNNHNREESSMSSLEDSTIEEEENVDTENFIENHVVFSNQDTSFDQTEDNIPQNQGFFTDPHGNHSKTTAVFDVLLCVKLRLCDLIIWKPT